MRKSFSDLFSVLVWVPAKWWGWPLIPLAWFANIVLVVMVSWIIVFAHAFGMEDVLK